MSASYEVRGNVAVITMNNPPVNGLGFATRQGIAAGLEQAAADPAVKAVVLSYYVNGRLTGPSTIASSESTTLEVAYVKPDGPVPSATMQLQKLYTSGWATVATFPITDGSATTTLAPNRTTDYRVANHDASRVSRTIRVTVKEPLPTSFTIEGSGFGHGVGMPQYGAYGAAKDGMTSTEILEYFYTDTNVSTRDTKKSIAVQILGPDPYSFSGYGDSRTSTTFRVLDDANWRIRDANDMAGAIEGTDSVTLSVDGTEVTADDGAQSVTAATLKIFWSGTRDWDGNGEDGVARLGGAQGEYRHGYFTASVIDGKLNVVNILLLNTEYLYGLAEMPSSWGLNGGTSALAAQAIAGLVGEYNPLLRRVVLVDVAASLALVAAGLLVGDPGWSVRGLPVGEAIAAGRVVTGTAEFDPTGRLNGPVAATFSLGQP